MDEFDIKPERVSIPEVIDKFRSYYRKSGQYWGQSLHIVMDDNNVTNADVDWVCKCALELGDYDAYELAVILRRMSRTQRSKISGMVEREVASERV